MGLDSFKSDDNSTTNTSPKVDTTTEQKSIDDAYKVFTSDDGRKKVFQTQEAWEDAVEFIKNELNMSIQQVENMNPTQRHDILHQAIIGEEGEVSQNFYPARECLVCGEKFSFPTNWKFSKFKGEAVCCDHSVKEVLEEYREINDIQG